MRYSSDSELSEADCGNVSGRLHHSDFVVLFDAPPKGPPPSCPLGSSIPNVSLKFCMLSRPSVLSGPPSVPAPHQQVVKLSGPPAALAGRPILRIAPIPQVIDFAMSSFGSRRSGVVGKPYYQARQDAHARTALQALPLQHGEVGVGGGASRVEADRGRCWGEAGGLRRARAPSGAPRSPDLWWASPATIALRRLANPIGLGSACYLGAKQFQRQADQFAGHIQWQSRVAGRRCWERLWAQLSCCEAQETPARTDNSRATSVLHDPMGDVVQQTRCIWKCVAPPPLQRNRGELAEGVRRIGDP